MGGVLAVVGHTARDLVDGSPPRAGGVPLYAARALAALGERAVVVTRCAGEDRALVRAVEQTGVPVVWRPEAQTPVFVLRNVGDRRELEIEALGSPWTVDDVDGWLGEAVAGADWVHAGALWRGEFPPETLAALARGRRLSFDGQGLVRPARMGPVVRDAEVDVQRVLASVDLLHLSRSEADTLGLTLEERSLRTLGVPEVVVTLGSRGCVVYADDLAEHVPAEPLRVADPTGAGDMFTLAYIALRRRGRDPAPAARRAGRLVAELLAGRVAAP